MPRLVRSEEAPPPARSAGVAETARAVAFGAAFGVVFVLARAWGNVRGAIARRTAPPRREVAPTHAWSDVHARPAGAILS